jgi:hypothetical protein
MDCPTFNLWRPTPAGSTIAISVAGNDDFFTTRVRVNCDGQPPVDWVHGELVPGPKTLVINDGISCSFTIIVVTVSTPEEPIAATATLTSATGEQLRTCTWHFTAAGSFAVVIDVLTN